MFSATWRAPFAKLMFTQLPKVKVPTPFSSTGYATSNHAIRDRLSTPTNSVMLVWIVNIVDILAILTRSVFARG